MVDSKFELGCDVMPGKKTLAHLKKAMTSQSQAAHRNAKDGGKLGLASSCPGYKRKSMLSRKCKFCQRSKASHSLDADFVDAANPKQM